LSISGNNASRVFFINTDITATLDGMTIRDGHAGNDEGGGILNRGTLTLSGSTISENLAISGGGVCNLGTLVVTSSTISNNHGPGEFEGDPEAGGILALTGTLNVINSTISGNTGGGIHTGYILGANPVINILNSTISGNTASGAGGGIESDYGVISVNNSLISGNTARISGGGIATGGAGSKMTIINSTVSGNVLLAARSTMGAAS
jgi:hypothetical protein